MSVFFWNDRFTFHIWAAGQLINASFTSEELLANFPDAPVIPVAQAIDRPGLWIECEESVV